MAGWGYIYKPTWVIKIMHWSITPNSTSERLAVVPEQPKLLFVLSCISRLGGGLIQAASLQGRTKDVDFIQEVLDNLWAISLNESEGRASSRVEFNRVYKRLVPDEKLHKVLDGLIQNLFYSVCHVYHSFKKGEDSNKELSFAAYFPYESLERLVLAHSHQYTTTESRLAAVENFPTVVREFGRRDRDLEALSKTQIISDPKAIRSGAEQESLDFFLGVPEEWLRSTS